MYEKFYGLTDKPFSLTPNPRFVFYSRQYREAEGQLLYGIGNGDGFMLVTGQPGTGKTTLCRDLIEKLDHAKTQSALLFNPFLNGIEMLSALLTEFGINVPSSASRKELLDRLNQFLLAQLALGKNCVAIFDEAQHLSPEFLEQIRVLSNLETDSEKLIQIILVGQPELLDKIRTPQMSQLDQRVSIRCTLTDLDAQETDRYIHHRLNVAGGRGQIRFTEAAVTEIFRGSHGVPRLINLISDRALLAGYAGQTRDIKPEHVRKAVAALRGEEEVIRAESSAPDRVWVRRSVVVATLAVVAIVSLGVAFWPRGPRLSPDDALYARAAAEPPPNAERDLRTLVATYPASLHVDDALLRLAQFEEARADHVAAIEHLSELARRAPAGALRTRAVVLASLDDIAAGDTSSACRTLTVDSTAATAGDTTLVRQLESVSSMCAARIAAVVATTDSVAAASAKSATVPKSPATKPKQIAPKPKVTP